MNVDPSHTANELVSLAVMRRVHDWAMESAQNSDINYFLRDLASTMYEVFGAKLVAIWDNNHRNKCLVLQASAPENADVVAWRAIATETSLTGAAVEKGDIRFFDNIIDPGGERQFTNPALAERLQLKTMLSIPVFSPTHRERVGLVLNLCYGSETEPGLSIPREDTKRLVSDLGTYVQYLVHRRDKRIMDDVRAVAAGSKGILSLFDGISNSLRELTRCTESALFRWDEGRGDLCREAPADLMLDAGGKVTPWLSESSDFDERFDSRLIPVCVEQKRSLVVRVDEPPEDWDSSAANVQCPYMAVPIHSSANEVLGVIRCKNPVTVDGKTSSFSSFDLIALKSFSRAIAPSVERFLRLREGSGLMKIVKDVSNALSRAYELDTSLQNMIETLVRAMHSKFGSIYLQQEETGTFVMQAATEPSRKLVESGASYRIGEGITGAIASGELLNFRSREEMRAHPNWAGKYHAQVWGEGSREDSDTLLGVPIMAGDRVIGLWKIENVVPNDAHPDPYYTDEDVQAAQVISYFFEYVIQNYKQEQARLRQFIQLAINSDRIQRAPDEEVSRKVVMTALEEAGFVGALLSLYDADTKLITETDWAGSTWAKGEARPCYIGDDDIRAVVLKRGREELIRDSSEDARCRNNPSGGRLKGQYVLPLRLDDELIGTLQVDVGRRRPTELERLTLRAFASHLIISISRRRSIRQTMSLTEQIMQSSRFTTAEALSGMAVHSLNHKLVQINQQLEKDLSRQEIRGNKILLDTLSKWQVNLAELEDDLKNALRFVRAPVDEAQPVWVDLHPEIQTAISTWINYIHSKKCAVRVEPQAARSRCVIPAAAFREIMAVLIVNSVQAHARRIEIKSYNDSNVKTANKKQIREAFCLEFADDGDGLPTSDYAKLFEPTFTTKPMNIGTGLGLFVAQRLAHRFRGDLEVIEKGRHSKGATFRLSLPLAKERKWPEKRGTA